MVKILAGNSSWNFGSIDENNRPLQYLNSLRFGYLIFRFLCEIFRSSSALSVMLVAPAWVFTFLKTGKLGIDDLLLHSLDLSYTIVQRYEFLESCTSTF